MCVCGVTHSVYPHRAGRPKTVPDHGRNRTRNLVCEKVAGSILTVVRHTSVHNTIKNK